MLKKLKKIDNRGFTIIEVMIVLAIAALILLIVLLAVPALQRNSRNTAIKNDAATVAGGINTYESDNNGTPPTNIASVAGTVTLSSGGGVCAGNVAQQTIKVQGSTAVSCVANPPNAAINPGTIQVYAGHQCPANNLGAGSVSNRAFSIYYSTETTAGNTAQCLTS